MLTRKDWDDISKLTFKNMPTCQILEVKVIESFIGVKPFPVVVVINTLASGIIARQYSLEGESETNDPDLDIVKVTEPQEDRYLIPLLYIMKNSLPIAKGPDDTFISALSAWSLITTVNEHKSCFTVQGTKVDFREIENFTIMINNQKLPFKDFADSRPMSLKDILNSTTKE